MTVAAVAAAAVTATTAAAGTTSDLAAAMLVLIRPLKMVQAQCSTTAVILMALQVLFRPTTSHQTSAKPTQTFRAVHPQTARVALSAGVSSSTNEFATEQLASIEGVGRALHLNPLIESLPRKALLSFTPGFSPVKGLWGKGVGVGFAQKVVDLAWTPRVV